MTEGQVKDSKLEDCEIDIELQKYDSLRKVYKLAFDRAAKGKGKAHHSRGENFEDQWICRGTRLFGIGGPLFQLGKKAEQVIKMEKPEDKIKELLDIINYAAATVIVLQEQKI